MFFRFTPGFTPVTIGQPLKPKYHLIGPRVIINWTCPHGDKGKFSPYKEINEMYANNLQVAASILLSGNNFTKIERMCSFLVPSFVRFYILLNAAAVCHPLYRRMVEPTKTSYLKSSKVWKWWSVVMASVTPQDALLKPCVTF